MRHGLLTGFLTILVLGGTAAVAREPAPITKREARSLPAQQVERRVMAQLSDILEEERWERRKPPVRPLADMDFTTRPYSTDVPNLCRVDRLSVSFRTIGDDDGDADTPAVAEGFTASHYFHFRQAPKSHYREVVDHERGPNPSACNGISLAKNDFFLADGEETATNGFLLAHRVMNEILGGKPDYQVECESLQDEKYRSCAGIVGEIRESSIDSISVCEDRDRPHSVCYKIYAGYWLIQVTAGPFAYGPDVTPQKVTINELIVLSHERVD